MNPDAAAKLGLAPYDSADYLLTDENMAAYLDAVLDEAPEDAALLMQAMDTVARARQRNMSQLARDAGLSREGLRKALSADGDPRLSTLLRMLRALGLRLHVAPAHTG